MKSILTPLACISITLIVGAVTGYIAIDSIPIWYEALNKPSFTPSNYFFAVIWPILYVMMGISLSRVWEKPGTSSRAYALLIFTAQLLLNFFWNIIFFDLGALGWAFLEILLLWSFVLSMILSFYKHDRTAALLQIPYLCWVSFLAFLNVSIWVLN